MKRLAKNKRKSNKILKLKGLNLDILSQLIFIKTGKKYSIPYISMILNGKRKAYKIKPIIRKILNTKNIFEK